MRARFEPELRVRTLADETGDDLLVAAVLAGTLADDLDFVALSLCVACVYPEQVAGEDRRLVAAGAAADLDEDVALVVRVGRQRRHLELALQ
jgi:hypothetical protein